MSTLADVLKAIRKVRARRTPSNFTRVHNAIWRCTDETSHLFQYYGKRGIQVHLAWLYNPLEFVAYLETLEGCLDPELWLDRIDNDGHYEPGNLRFITPSESASNRGCNGTVIPLYDITDELLLVSKAMRKGWSKYISYIGDQRSPTWWRKQYVEHKFYGREIGLDLQDAIDKLEPRERYVIEARFYYNMTLEEAGKELGITRERIRQLETKALRKLKERYEATSKAG